MNRNKLLAALALPIILIIGVGSSFFPYKDKALVDSSAVYNIDSLAQQTICTGSVVLPDKTELDGADPSFNPMPEKPHTQTLVNTTGPVIFGSLFNLNETGEEALNQSDISYLSTASEEPKLLGTAFDTTSNTMGSAGVSSSYVNKGDLKGLAVDNCQKPEMESWIIGGNSHITSAPVLVITNPSASSGTASLDVYTTSSSGGPVNYSATKNISVPAFSEKRVFLSAGAPAEDGLAVHTKFYGAAMTTTVQYSELDGITPRGIDFIKNSAAFSKEQIIPGIKIKSGPLQMNLLSLSSTNATVEIIDSSTNEVAKSQSVDLINGRVNVTKIDGLKAGNYFARVKSDNNIIAGARADDAKGSENDFAYFSSIDGANNSVGLIPNNTESDIVIYGVNDGGVNDASFVLSYYNSAGKLISQKTKQLESGKALHISAKELKKEKVQYVFVNTQSLSTKLFAGQSLFMTG
ncbi:MAG: DUF5719 family protein, partial [Bifidobacteriaceae bacterium]|nr:DUF5719 family protein [Bifidobacteriaceae bacterium]